MSNNNSGNNQPWLVPIIVAIVGAASTIAVAWINKPQPSTPIASPSPSSTNTYIASPSPSPPAREQDTKKQADWRIKWEDKTNGFSFIKTDTKTWEGNDNGRVMEFTEIDNNKEDIELLHMKTATVIRIKDSISCQRERDGSWNCKSTGNWIR
jgi:hypothetical protein